MANSARLENLRSLFQKHLNLPASDRMVVDYLVATVVANSLPQTTDPLWGWLIGPPSSGKNELLRAFRPHPSTVFISSLTENALISGHKDKDLPDEDPSLLPHIIGKTLVCPDFTAIVECGEATVNKILGDMRVLYGDEPQMKASGTAGQRRYQGKFGVIFGVTPTIDTILTRHQQLGARLVGFRIEKDAAHRPVERRLQMLRHVHQAMQTKHQWRKTLARAVSECLDAGIWFGQKQGFIPLPPQYETQLLMLGDCVARLRSAPIHGMVTAPETGSRITQQLIYLGQGRILADERTEWRWDDWLFLVRVAKDTLPRHVLDILRILLPREGNQDLPAVPVQEVCMRTCLPATLVTAIARQYRYLGLMTPDSGRRHLRLTPTCIDELTQAGLLYGQVPL